MISSEVFNLKPHQKLQRAIEYIDAAAINLSKADNISIGFDQLNDAKSLINNVIYGNPMTNNLHQSALDDAIMAFDHCLEKHGDVDNVPQAA